MQDPAPDGHNPESYISHEKISSVRHAVLDELMIWQIRQLDEFCRVIFLHALRIKVRDGGREVNNPAHLTIGVGMAGVKHILEIWLVKEEGASLSGACMCKPS